MDQWSSTSIGVASVVVEPPPDADGPTFVALARAGPDGTVVLRGVDTWLPDLEADQQLLLVADEQAGTGTVVRVVGAAEGVDAVAVVPVAADVRRASRSLDRLRPTAHVEVTLDVDGVAHVAVLEDVSLTGLGLRVAGAAPGTGAVVVTGRLVDGAGAPATWQLRGRTVWTARRGTDCLLGVRVEPGQRLTTARLVQWVRRGRSGGAHATSA